MATVRVLSKADVAQLVTLNDAMRLVEEAYIEFYRGGAHVYPAVRERISPTAIFGIKSAFMTARNYLGLKAGGFWKENVKKGLTNHQSTLLLLDPETGAPVAVMDANYVTGIRTGAVGGVALRRLAPNNASVLSIIGLGTQGRMQLKAAAQVLNGIEEVRYYDIAPSGADAFLEETFNSSVKHRRCETPEEAVRGTDILITVTPGNGAVVDDAWVGAGVHINAIGTDTIGKQELDPRLVARTKIVTDWTTQCAIMGEIQHAIKARLIEPEQVHGELGALLAGDIPGRTDDDELTLFDATGLAIQDLVVGGFAFEQAVAKGIGTEVTL